mmetsp:Transcript_176844/g.561467  ORF Transcript_176844/g.561467 Transcript_176844/m.561467 type:complete len:80 (+) Transcript_176844:164-403(+)
MPDRFVHGFVNLQIVGHNLILALNSVGGDDIGPSAVDDHHIPKQQSAHADKVATRVQLMTITYQSSSQHMRTRWRPECS